MNDTQPCSCTSPDCTGLVVHTEPEHCVVYGRPIREMTAGELGLCGPRENA